MPMISFSGETSQGPFWKQIQEGTKTQTVRRPRKRPIQEGDTLQLYWKVRVPKDKKPIHLINTAVCTRVRSLTYIDFAFDDAFAKRDGFRDHHELQEWFGNPFLHPNTEYVLIEWRLLHSVDIEKKMQQALGTATVEKTGKCSTTQEPLQPPSVAPTKLTLEERAQKCIDLEDELKVEGYAESLDKYHKGG